MNEFYETLVEELREDLGDVCAADWDEFHDEIKFVEESSKQHATQGMDEFEIDELALKIASEVEGTRVDLPSINKFIYAEIERAAK